MDVSVFFTKAVLVGTILHIRGVCSGCGCVSYYGPLHDSGVCNGCACVGLHGPLHMGKICNGCVCAGSLVHYTRVRSVMAVSVLAPWSITRYWGL